MGWQATGAITGGVSSTGYGSLVQLNAKPG